jgi:hypothetical protein
MGRKKRKRKGFLMSKLFLGLLLPVLMGSILTLWERIESIYGTCCG